MTVQHQQWRLLAAEICDLIGSTPKAKGTTEAPKSSFSRSGHYFECGSSDHLQRDYPKNNNRDGKGLIVEFDEESH
jgi:hypothetical protein